MSGVRYENRVVAFVDVLGFGALVESSSGRPAVVEGISRALAAAQPDALQSRLYVEANWNNIREHERASARATLAAVNRAMAANHEVRISYFSDSLVLSAEADDLIATQLVVDIVGRLQMTFWRDHSLLLRGGIALGELVHVQGGQLFGPAMNCAYRMESKVAVYPRVVISEDCWAHFQSQDTFGVLAPFFHQDEQGVRGMSLAECYLQLLEHSSLFLTDARGERELRQSLKTAPSQLKTIRASMTEARIQAKYDWLIPRVGQVRARYFK